MTTDLSHAQVDRLGDRLRRGETSNDDLRLLDEYRGSFDSVYEEVVATIRNHLGLVPTGRAAKSTASIVHKLKRESIRLSQIQDIAGCRVVVADIPSQNLAVKRLAEVFDGAAVADRRLKPSHGYRAVHVIAHREGKSIEIQVRTGLQHLWAELSEKLSDKEDISVKYGGGSRQSKALLISASEAIAAVESMEERIANMLATGSTDDDVIKKVVIQFQSTKDDLQRLLENVIARISLAAKGSI